MDLVCKIVGAALILLSFVHPNAGIDTSWTYHDLTGSCMKVFRNKKDFSNARRDCEVQNAVLVGIHKKETNDFVKGLLETDESAFIGLYREGNNKHGRILKWVDGTPYQTGSFTDFRIRNIDNYVTIGGGGWESHYSSPTSAYICQKKDCSPPPSIVCDPVEERKEDPYIISSQFVGYKSFGAFNKVTIENMNTTDLRVECLPSQTCRNNDDVHGKLTVTSGDPQNYNASVTVKTVATRKDDGSKWKVAYTFVNINVENFCTMKTYVVPEGFVCELSYPQDGGVRLNCSAHSVYPEAKIEISHKLNGQITEKWSPDGTHSSHNAPDGTKYFKSEFQRKLTRLDPGRHEFVATSYPDISFSTESARSKASREEKLPLDVAVPLESPKFEVMGADEFVAGMVKTRLNQNLSLVCQVAGGKPAVTSTTITCDHGVKGQDGRGGGKVEVDIMVTREMDGQNCHCRADHVSGRYNKTATASFSVLSEPIITRFTVEDKGTAKKELEVNAGRSVTFECDVLGNPIPNIQLMKYQSGEEGENSEILTKKTGTEISHTNAKISCRDAGIYACKATNNLSEAVETLKLKVLCKAQPVSERDYDQRFFLKPDTSEVVIIKIYVYLYPPPRSNRIFVKTNAYLSSDEVKTNFTYIDEDRQKGVINLVFSPGVAKAGNYSLVIEQDRFQGHGKIDFIFTLPEKPMCPIDFNATVIGSSFVTLSWSPQFDGGLKQTFWIAHHKGEDDVPTNYEIADISDSLLSYNITGLNPDSAHSFHLSVENEKGKSECVNQRLNVTTEPHAHGEGGSTDGAQAVGIILAVVITLILVLVVLLALVYWRRRQNRKYVYTNNVSQKDTPKTDEQEMTNRDIYAVVNKEKKKPKPVHENIYNNDSSTKQTNGTEADPPATPELTASAPPPQKPEAKDSAGRELVYVEVEFSQSQPGSFRVKPEVKNTAKTEVGESVVYSSVIPQV